MFDQITLEPWTAVNAGPDAPDAPSFDWRWHGSSGQGAAPLFVAESDTRIRLWFALPPLHAETLKLEVRGSTIWMRAMAFRPEVEAGEIITLGRMYDIHGSWTLRLPFEVQAGEVEAVHANGMLEVIIDTSAMEHSSVPVSLKAA